MILVFPPERDRPPAGRSLAHKTWLRASGTRGDGVAGGLRLLVYIFMDGIVRGRLGDETWRYGVLYVLLETNFEEDVEIARVADPGRFSWLEGVESSQYRRHLWSLDQGVLYVLRIS